MAGEGLRRLGRSSGRDLRCAVRFEAFDDEIKRNRRSAPISTHRSAHLVFALGVTNRAHAAKTDRIGIRQSHIAKS